MKVLICLFAVLAVANAGHLLRSGVYGNGVYSTGNIIASPYVQSAPIVHSVASPIYHSAPPPVYRSAPIISAHAQVVGSPIVSHPYGLSYGPRFASTYGIGSGLYNNGLYNAAGIYNGGLGLYNGGLLKRQ